MTVERHWWNGVHGGRGRRDVYLCSNGPQWEVQAQTGGASGPTKKHECPSRAAAQILADAWMGGRPEWRELVASPSR